MKAIILDTETTGLDFKKDRILEVGYRFTDNNFLPITDGFQHLMWDQTYPEVTEEITALTSIDMGMLAAHALPPLEALSELGDAILVHSPDVVVCFNSEFDETLMKADVARTCAGLIPGINHLMQLPWICAMKDLETNYRFKCWKLSHLALDYGVSIDPKTLHRALADVNLTMKLLQEANATVQGLYDYNKLPWVVVAAMTTKPWEDGSKSVNIAKKHGYSFEVPRGDNTGRKFDKQWVKRIKEHQFEQEQKTTPLQVSIIK